MSRKRASKLIVPVSPALRKQRLLERLIACDKAQDDLITYTTLTSPVPSDPDNVNLSLYTPVRHHRVIAAGLEQIAMGFIKRLIIACPPRHGKTELASKRFVPWFSGKFPDKSVIFGSYNEKYAGDIGKAVRDHMLSNAHLQVFPDPRAQLKVDSRATDRLETEAGGVLAFVGRGGTTTGRGAHVFVLDDPIKDQKEARSPTIRNDLWEWFNRVVATRLMDKDAAIVIIQTRWHEDDLIGRLTDPHNDYYDPAEARNWKIIDLPALALDNDPMGRRPGDALWPERFDEKFLEEQQRRDPIGFSALYQGRPTPAAGNMIDPKWLRTYKPHELPKNLRYYAASDHAVTEEQRHDKTCLMIVGIDEQDNIYVLPDVWWRKANTLQTVEGMLDIIRRYRPIFWWAEKTHISKSIGPFLRKRMLEERLHCAIVEVTPIGDKQTRAQSIQGRLAMEKVFFPERAMWWPEARDQLSKFPGAPHDDFVDALAYIGLGLNMLTSAAPPPARDRPPAPRTFGELIADTRRRERDLVLSGANKGW